MDLPLSLQPIAISCVVHQVDPSALHHLDDVSFIRTSTEDSHWDDPTDRFVRYTQ